MDFALILREDCELNMNGEWITGGDCAFGATVLAQAVLMSMNYSGSMPTRWSHLHFADKKGSLKSLIAHTGWFFTFICYDKGEVR